MSIVKGPALAVFDGDYGSPRPDSQVPKPYTLNPEP
jgi:hypothetical protein